MPQLMKLSFERPPYIYEVELGWDADAYVDNEIALEVRGSRQSIEGEPDRYELAVSVAVNTERQLVIRAEPFGEVSIALSELFGAHQIIDRIPSVFFAGEPIVGCLVRSGLSASISQIIECNNETAGIDWYRPRIKAIAHCLRENVANIGIKMAGRAIRCVAFLGVG